jgi:hypothetical protein
MKPVIVTIKTEPGGFSTSANSTKYLTLEEAVDAGVAYLHALAEAEQILGLVDIEEN